MALTINGIVLGTGILVNDSYARIDTVSGSKNYIQMTLNYYVDNDAFLGGKSYLKQEAYAFIPSVDAVSPNFIKQGYEYLKTLEYFLDAVDA